jgi:hypothetical protein
MEDTLYNNIEQVLEENDRRQRALEASARYDPLTGEGCWGERVEVSGCHLPRSVLARHPDYASLPPLEQERCRIVEDFEYWCARCVTIKDKMSSRNVPLVLNQPQRRLLAVMEEQRAAGQPVRVIVLKARQWGGSTLVQMYLAWMQLVRHKGWNSIICGHLHVTSKSIKRMYNLLLRRYPRELTEEDGPLLFTKLEGQPNVQQIEARDCLVLTSSARSEDAVRGYDIAMAHLSEVAFWKASAMHSPDDLVRSVCGSVALKPETVIVLESTANGVGDYFHDEWTRTLAGQSDKEALFVPWYEIEIYRKRVDDAQALWDDMDEYEHKLWDEGRTLEQINWYHYKRREYRDHSLMMAEYPNNELEAFVATGSNPFDPEHLDELERGCMVEPIFKGDIMGAGPCGLEAKKDIRLVEGSKGLLKVWELPEKRTPTIVKYLVVVDVGGRSADSDYSVIAVWRVGDGMRKSAIVAQWRGHIDHDQLAWKSMQLAVFYNKALLVIESNTLTNEEARAGESNFILDKLYSVYGNLYKRNSGQLGFHTNAKTKPAAVTALIEALRDGGYVERDRDAVNEMRNYEYSRGRYAARVGKHDDILMTRAIGLLLLGDKRVFSRQDTPPAKSLTADDWNANRCTRNLNIPYSGARY